MSKQTTPEPKPAGTIVRDPEAVAISRIATSMANLPDDESREAVAAWFIRRFAKKPAEQAS